MFAKAAIKEVVSTTSRLGQRRASIEIQKTNVIGRRNSICGPCGFSTSSLSASHASQQTTASELTTSILNINKGKCQPHSSISNIATTSTLNPSTSLFEHTTGKTINNSIGNSSQYHTTRPLESFVEEGSIPTILENGKPLDLNFNTLKKDNIFMDNIKRRGSLNNVLKSHNRRYSLDGLPSLRMSNISETNGEFFKTDLTSNPIKKEIMNVMDTDVKKIFDSVWSEVVKTHGKNMNIPNDCVFLLGGPGAGKGTNTAVLSKAMGIEAEPIVVSSLLNSEECILLKKQGKLVNDQLVLELLMKELMKPDHLGTRSKGIIIDGFPRNEQQVKFVELLYEKMVETKAIINPNGKMPRFRVTCLHVNEEESVARQLSRGNKTIQENIKRKSENKPLLEVRDTDIDPAACKKRYDIYLEQYNNLKNLSAKFEYSEINANGTLPQVESLIVEKYGTVAI